VTWRDLRSLFGACGQIERADIMYTGSGVPMDRGIVYFETESQAKDAVRM
jgi:RNA recognition motif-containing protein